MVYIQQFEAAAKIDFKDIIQQTVKQFKSEIIKLNQDQLEQEGVDSKGKKLPPYAASTVRIKKRKGQRTDHMTLKDTGAFYEGFYLLAFHEFWEQGSRDSKAGKLEGKWSHTYDEGTVVSGGYGDIFGITEENLNKLMWQMGFVEKLKQNYINAI